MDAIENISFLPKECMEPKSNEEFRISLLHASSSLKMFWQMQNLKTAD
jgi:hypothetical protein